MKFYDYKGIRFRLYVLFVGFAIVIVATVWIIQLFNIKQRLRDETLESLQNITWNISATYGTDAYYKAMRAAAYSGEYLIKTMNEDGVELDTIGIVGKDIEWPQRIIETDDLIEQLNHSNGYIHYTIQDKDKTYIVYAQVLASWEGKREIIFVAQSTEHEQQRIRSLLFQLIQSTCVVLVIAVLMAWILTKKFLRPIVKITNSAKKLAKGDYSVTFPKNTYTEINLLSDTLDRAANEFANYEQIRRDLIANLSHDMRTPLTMIKAYAEMIDSISGDNPEKRKKHLQIITSQADKLSEFVNSSLNLAKLQSKEATLNKTKFSLGKLANEVIQHMQIIYRDGVEFDSNINTKYMIKADQGMIGQVLYNLINNAIKYSGKTVHVNVRKDQKNILFEVIDHGSGIAKEDIPQIWIKYYKVNPFANDSGSTGVGLSIVKEILEQHGFDYGVESEVGVGSRFWFSVDNKFFKDLE